MIRNGIYTIGVLLALSAFSANVHAQTGKVTVLADPRLDEAIQKRNRELNGYRIQIYFGTDRNAANNAREQFRNAYPAYEVYLKYQQPNYKIRVGDFRTEIEAQKLLHQLTS